MKTLKFMAIAVLSAVVAISIAVVVLLLTNSEAAFVSTAFFGGLLIALIMGAFDVNEKTRYDSIRHKMGRKSYGQAAIFLGTACVFVGTPKECEERADDLWHYGHQVRVEENIDGMEFSIL